MAAPHVDNPFGPGANPSKGAKEDTKKGLDKTANDEKEDASEAVPLCSHPFCTAPSDPGNYPIGLPWSSGLLKCLPGYCKKHVKDALENMLLDEEGEEQEAQMEWVCKCQWPLRNKKKKRHISHKQSPSRDNKKRDKDLKNNKKRGKERTTDKSPYGQYIYSKGDPSVPEELTFFLTMMMAADELDKWGDEKYQKEKEKQAAAKKKKKPAVSKAPSQTAVAKDRAKVSQKPTNAKKKGTAQSEATKKDKQVGGAQQPEPRAPSPTAEPEAAPDESLNQATEATEDQVPQQD